MRSRRSSKRRKSTAPSAATDNPAAYDLYLHGLADWNRWTKEGNAKAFQHFYAAMKKDHDFSTPYGLAASCYLLAKANDWLTSNFDDKEIAQLVDRAADIGVDDPVALCWAGHAPAYFFKDVDRAIAADRSRARAGREPGDRLATKRLGSRLCRRPDRAIKSLNKAIRLNPLDPRVFLTQSAMAFAHFIIGRDDEAAHWAAKALRVKPNWMPALRVAMACNGMRGHDDEAKRALKSYAQVDPEVSIAKICRHYPFRREIDRQRLMTALRKSGVPE